MPPRRVPIFIPREWFSATSNPLQPSQPPHSVPFIKITIIALRSCIRHKEFTCSAKKKPCSAKACMIASASTPQSIKQFLGTESQNTPTRPPHEKAYPHPYHSPR